MKIKYILPGVALLCAMFVSVSAQTQYSLESCRAMAIENNQKIANSRLEIQSAEEVKKNAFTNYFPSVSASGFGFKAKNALLSSTIPEMNMEFPIPPALGLPIPSLPVTTPEMSFGFLDDGFSGAITMVQPVFMGGKIITGNKLANLGVDINKQKLRLSENEVLLQVETLYWDIVSLYEKGKTIDIIDRQLAALLADVELAYTSGLITINDVLKVKLKQNELKSAKLNLDNNIRLAKMALCRQIGTDMDRSDHFDIVIAEINEPRPPLAYYVDHRDALNIRAETHLLEKGVEAAKLQTKMKRAGQMPSVAVGATCFQHNFTDKWQRNGVAFVTVSIPVSGWWGGSHAIKKQKIEEKIAYNNMMDGMEQLLLQMQSARNELDHSYKQILISKESIGQATENLRISNDHYKAGIVKISDLLDAQTLLQQSRDKYVEDHSIYQKKLFEYLQVTGR